MKEKKLPELFCKKGAFLNLKTELEIQGENGKIIYQPGEKFKVDDIIGYGFDLEHIKTNHYIRIINSDMHKYFDKPLN